MGNGGVVAIFFAVTVLITACVLVAGWLLLRRQAAPLAWRIYLGGVVVSILLTVGLTMNAQLVWQERLESVTDRDEFWQTLLLALPLVCCFVVFLGGTLFGLLGLMAAQERGRSVSAP